MEATFDNFFPTLHWSVLALIIVVILLILGRAADWLVDEAVVLSEHLHLPKVVIGATVVSLGTTMPEAAVSVLAAIQGSPGLALGNAVGSIACDTGLILGLACVIAPLRLDRKIVNRQGWIQLGAAVALVAGTFPWRSSDTVFSSGGRLPQFVGVAFLAALVFYLYDLIVRGREGFDANVVSSRSEDSLVSNILVVARLFGAIAIVVVSARVLIPAVTEGALRLHVPPGVIAATLVAFGTSLPELVTAVTAARRGHGELAVGNIVGADVLNVLFVAGAAAAVTPGGLVAGGHFFKVLFPSMLLILIIFRITIFTSGQWMKRPFGFVLIAAYVLYILVSYIVPADGAKF